VIKVKVNGKQEFVVTNPGDESVEINGNTSFIDLKPVKEGTFHLLKDGHSYTVDVIKHDPQTKTMQVLVNGNKYNLELRDKYDELLSSLGMNVTAKAVKEMKAPMPGMVLDVMVKPGDSVNKDQALLVLEAMKMENVLKSPGDAVVKSIVVTKGTAVEKNQVLITFE